MMTINNNKGIYLCARRDRHYGYLIDYNDISNKYGCNLVCDCLDIDLSVYSFIIATPPCNYYSKANWRRESSKVALSTKHLLPCILAKLTKQDKPFIVENVCNDSLLPSEYDKYCFRYTFGGHTFWSNVNLDLSELTSIKQNKQYVTRELRDNNPNVHNVIRLFLDTIYSSNFTKCVSVGKLES